MKLSSAALALTMLAPLAACDEGVAERPAAAPEGTGGSAANGGGTNAGATTDAPGDAGSASRRSGPYHAITVALCVRAGDLCAGAQATTGDARADYVVAFGSGAGTLRTREQAMADVYKEIRDRTSWGTHLAAKPHHLELPADASVPSAPEPRAERTSDADPLVEASFELMTLVDTDGEITIDTTSSYGPCKLGLADGADRDGGTSRCYVAVEKPATSGGGGRRR